MATTYKEYILADISGEIAYKNFSKYNTLCVNSALLGDIKSIHSHGNDYIINFASSSVVLKNGKKNLRYIKTSENTTPLKISSPDFPIDLYITAPQKGLTVSGTANDDKILLSSYPVPDGKTMTIKAGKGDDYIEPSLGKDKIIGGAGSNTIFFNNTNFGCDTIVLTKNEKLEISFDGDIEWGNFSFTPVNKNKDLEISAENFENSKITISNYVSKNIGASVTVNGVNVAETPSLAHITKENYFEIPDKKEKTVYKGTALADYVDASNVSYNIKNPLTIKTGAGNDTIVPSVRVDNITAGNGHNTIVYNNKMSFNEDKIYLTKGEKLDIDVSSLIKNQNYTSIEYKINGKNLEVIFTGTISNKFTIMNFGSVDASNNSTKKTEDTSEINLITDEGIVDLKKVLLKEQKVVKNYTGSWRADNINANDYKIIANKKTKEISTDYSKRGLTLNGGGGNDKIQGSDYSDTITGGAGIDTINAGLGKNNIIFTNTSGNDIIENGGGTDTLVFKGIKYNTVSAILGEGLDKNLYIDYGTCEGKITVENFVDDYENGTNSVKYLKIGNKSYSIEEFLPESYLEELNTKVLAWQSSANQVCNALSLTDNLSALYNPICNVAVIQSEFNDVIEQI